MTNNMKCRVEAENAASSTGYTDKNGRISSRRTDTHLEVLEKELLRCKTTFRNPEELRCKIVLLLRMDF